MQMVPLHLKTLPKHKLENLAWIPVSSLAQRLIKNIPSSDMLVSHEYPGTPTVRSSRAPLLRREGLWGDGCLPHGRGATSI